MQRSKDCNNLSARHNISPILSAVTTKGSALLTALFIMTLVAIVATAMSTRLQLDIYRTRLLVAHDKLYFASQAVMFWAFNELDKNDNKLLHGRPKSNALLRSYPNNMHGLYKGVTLSGGLYDVQGKLNLNNLVEKKGLPPFINLIHHIYPKSNDKDIISLALALQDWLSDYDLDKGNDNYMAYYTAQNPPYYPSHQLMKSASEFRLIKGVTAKMNDTVQPYITVLPESTPININSAAKKILASLGNGLDEHQLEELVTARGKGFKTMKKVTPLLQKFNIPNNQIAIESTYFLSKAEAKNEDFSLTVYVLLKREKSPKGKIKVSVVRESFNSF